MFGAWMGLTVCVGFLKTSWVFLWLLGIGFNFFKQAAEKLFLEDLVTPKRT